jgi:hypothetical protein
MAYSVTGRATEFCSCITPCPCAFGEKPDNERCTGAVFLDIQDGQLDGTSLSGAKAILVNTFSPGPWTAGNMTASLILDSNDSQEQRDALSRIFGGEEGGEAADLSSLISDFKGVVEAPIESESSDERVSFKAGDLAEGSGSVLKGVDGSEIRIPNPNYIMTNITAGKTDKVVINMEGLEYSGPGTGFWTGPFAMKG